MKTRFQDLVQEASLPQRIIKISTGGLFVGLSTEADIWGQKQQKYKPEDSDEAWSRDKPSPRDDDQPSPKAEKTEQEAPPVEVVLIDEDQIVAELNLTENMSVRELQAARRAFARRNHPDAISSNRVVGEDRMKIANRIIDDHIRLRAQP